VGDHEIVVGASLGISVFPDDGDTASDLLRSADVAMYHAKDEGRNNFQFYCESMNEKVEKNLRVEGMLRKALEEEQLLVHYQPRIETATGAINGVEALVRILHPELGMVPPVEFIPVAEDTGLIIPLGLSVLRTACAQNKAWQTLGFKPFNVSVNVSTQQIRRPGLVEAVETILRETGLEPGYLELEITESVFLEDERRARETLDRLRAMGIVLAIDDFGTGYSSMSYLKRFPIGMVKIDRSFVKDVAENPENRGIVAAIISVSQELGLKVVAEGVETREEEDFLRTRECDSLQGYRFGRPMEPEGIVALLTREAAEEEQSA
jgi:predicted signal transduction protein with EAL and GGDEF domain